MSVSLPKFPYSHLRDDRPKRLMGRDRLLEICEAAAKFRRPFCDLFGKFDALEALQHGLPEGIYFFPDDRHFVAEGGFMKGVEAYCDFSSATVVFLREYIWHDLFSETENCPRRRNAFEVIAHEFGHVNLPSHKRKLNARARQANQKMARAAYNAHEVNRGDNIALKARHLDLEEEADCFQFATLVPVTQLDGSLSISDLVDTYDVSPSTAYEAAMLAKDYRRALFLRSLK